jgi:hypothetical protein
MSKENRRAFSGSIILEKMWRLRDGHKENTLLMEGLLVAVERYMEEKRTDCSRYRVTFEIRAQELDD